MQWTETGDAMDGRERCNGWKVAMQWTEGSDAMDGKERFWRKCFRFATMPLCVLPSKLYR